MLFAVITTAVTVVAVGQLSRWNPAWMIITAFVGFVILARFFYGFDASRAIDKAGVEPGSVGGLSREEFWRGGPSEADLIVDAYEKAKRRNPAVEESEFKRLVAEEDNR